MKWIELTDEQMEQIPKKHFGLMAANRPAWLAANRPAWMAEYRPDLMASYRPDLLAARPDVPEDIVAKINSPTGAERKS